MILAPASKVSFEGIVLVYADSTSGQGKVSAANYRAIATDTSATQVVPAT